MSSLNKVTIIGNVGNNPEGRVTANGRSVTTISVATNEQWKSQETLQTRTEWHRIVLWDRLAEIAVENLAKGCRVYIEGRLQTRSWQDSSGNKRFSTEIIASQLKFLDKARSEAVA